MVIRKDLPLEMRVDLEKLFVRLKDHDIKLAESVAQGKTNGMVRVYHEDYGLMCQAADDERAARKETNRSRFGGRETVCLASVSSGGLIRR